MQLLQKKAKKPAKKPSTKSSPANGATDVMHQPVEAFLYQVKQSLMRFLETTLCFHGTLTHCILQAHMPLNMLLLGGSMNGTSFQGSRNYTSGIIAKRRLYAQTATDRCREDHFDNHVVGVAKVVHVYFADTPEASSSPSCA